MIEQLNAEFVNAWIVRPQFIDAKAIEAAFQDEATRRVVRAVAREFTYPVDSLVVSADGEVVAQCSIDEILRQARGEDWLSRYQRLLEEGLAKAR
ncbi:MAG: hypothetical protein JNL90_16195 [Planctomycetes bacterium]|nr:hypothetical protein [Planctomycetota bacterium]